MQRAKILAVSGRDSAWRGGRQCGWRKGYKPLSRHLIFAPSAEGHATNSPLPARLQQAVLPAHTALLVIARFRRKLQRQLQDKSFEEVLRGAAVVFSSRISETFFTMATSIFVARVYGAEVVGALAAIRAVLEILTIFSLLGTDVGLLRLIPQHRKTSDRSAFLIYQKTIKLVAFASIALSIVLFFGAQALADALHKPHLGAFYALAAWFVLPKTVFKMNLEALRGMKLFGSVANQNVSLAILNLGFLVLLTILLLDKYVPIQSYFLTMGLTGIISTYLAVQGFRKRVKKDQKVSPMSTKSILKVSLPMFVTKSAFLILGHADILMITYFMAESDVGFYQVAWKLVMFNKFFKNSITSTSAPKQAELFAEGKMDDLKRVAKKTTALLGYTILPFMLLLIVFGKPLLSGLYGPEFMAGYTAFMWLCVAQIITSLIGHVGMFMNMCGKQSVYMRMVIMSAVMNIVGNAILIPMIGITGAAISNVISVVFVHVIASLYIKRTFGFTIMYWPIGDWFRRLRRSPKP